MNKTYERLIYGFLLSLTLLLTLQPFFRVGLTVGDDAEFLIQALRGETFKDFYDHAIYSGRFYYLFTKPFYYITYYLDNFYLGKIVQYASLLLSYSLFAAIIHKIFKVKYITLSVFLFLLLFTPITSFYHIPFISYPVYYTFSFSLLLGGLLLFLQYTESGKYKWVIFSALLFLCGIPFYESYLQFLLYMALFILIRSIYLRGFKKSFVSRDFYKEIVPFIIVGVLYMAAYIGFRIYAISVMGAENMYPGTNLAKDFSLKNFFVVLFKTNRSVSPGGMYKVQSYLFTDFSSALSGHANNLWHILRNADLNILINGMIQAALFILFFAQMSYNISWKKVFIGIISAFLFAISSHFLLAIADKYNTSWYAWMQGYVTSYFAYFGIILLCFLCCYAIVKLCRKQKILKWSSIAGLALTVFIYSVITSYSNHHIANDMQLTQNKFFMIDEMIKDKSFNRIPDGSVVHAPDLNKTASILTKGVGEVNDLWATYFQKKAKKNWHIFTNEEQTLRYIKEHPEKELFTIEKADALKTNDMLMVISKIDKEASVGDSLSDSEFLWLSKEIDFYYYSPFKNFTFGFSLADTLHTTVFVNEWDTIPLHQGINMIPILSSHKQKKITYSHLRTDGFFEPRSYFITLLKTGEE